MSIAIPICPSATYYLTLQFLPTARTCFDRRHRSASQHSRWRPIKLSRSILSPFTRPGGKPVAQALVEHRQRERGPKVVAIGGGTGLSTLLRGLKHYTSNITAIVTVADDGGSSGRLRREMGVLPPGDFRNCLAALADDEVADDAVVSISLRARAERSGRTRAGQSCSSRPWPISSGSFEQALIESSRVLAITGRILPSTLNDVTLCAEVRNGHGLEHVEGESAITHFGGAIERVYLQPDHVRAYPETIRAILDADLIVLGPGSLYTSILPNLLINSLPEALRASRAMKLYICNVATQHGETDGYTRARSCRRARKAHRHEHHRRRPVQCAHRYQMGECAGRRGRDCAHPHAGRPTPHHGRRCDRRSASVAA